MIYLDMGLERAEAKTQQFIVFTLLTRLGALATLPATQQHNDTILQLFLASCDKFKLTKELVLDPPSKLVLLDFINDVLLFVPLLVAPQPAAAAAAPIQGLRNAANPLLPGAAEVENPQPPADPVIPGLSEKARRRVLGLATAAGAQTAPSRFTNWKIDDWAQKKAYLASDFLLEGAINGPFTESEVFVSLLIASGDGNARVQRAGEDALKRLPRVMLEEKAVVDRLFLLVTGSATNTKLEATERRQPASNVVRIKAFEQLVRSQLALNSFPANLQASFEALFGAATTPRLKMQGVGFIQAVIRSAGDLSLKLFGPVILTGALLKLLREIAKDESTRM